MDAPPPHHVQFCMSLMENRIMVVSAKGERPWLCAGDVVIYCQWIVRIDILSYWLLMEEYGVHSLPDSQWNCGIDPILIMSLQRPTTTQAGIPCKTLISRRVCSLAWFCGLAFEIITIINIIERWWRWLHCNRTTKSSAAKDCQL